MKQLSKPLALAMLAGAAGMVVGVALVIFCAGSAVAAQPVGAVLFALGAGTFAGVQITQTYEGTNFTIKRLRRIMLFGDAMFILAALLLLENTFHFLRPLFYGSMEGYSNYVRYVHNNWVVALLVAAIFEMYSTHRISYELKKG